MFTSAGLGEGSSVVVPGYTGLHNTDLSSLSPALREKGEREREGGGGV